MERKVIITKADAKRPPAAHLVLIVGKFASWGLNHPVVHTHIHTRGPSVREEKEREREEHWSGGVHILIDGCFSQLGMLAKVYYLRVHVREAS